MSFLFNITGLYLCHPLFGIRGQYTCYFACDISGLYTCNSVIAYSCTCYRYKILAILL